MNRHPVQLALAARTLQQLSRGRAIIGLGSGAAPGSKFAREHEALGTHLAAAPDRRAMLIEAIGLVRSLWAGATSFEGRFFTVQDFDFALSIEDPPPIIIGASGPETTRLALEHGDGLNVANLAALSRIEDIILADRRPDFDVSVHIALTTEDATSFVSQMPEPSEVVDRWVFAVPADLSTDRLDDLWATATTRLQQ